MIGSFFKEISKAWTERRYASLPRLLPIVVFVSLVSLAYCVASVYFVPDGKPAEFNFMEGGAITALSAVFLSLGCAFAIASNLIHFRSKGTYQLIWIVFAFGLAFLAFDELLQLHERVGRIAIDQILPRVFFRNWNDAIVVMYGVVSIPLMLYLLPALLRYRMVPELFLAAFLFYAVHTLIDSTQDPATYMSQVFEESAKLFSAAFLFMGSLAGLIGNVWSFVGKESTKDIAKENGNGFRQRHLDTKAVASQNAVSPSAKIH